MKYKVFLSLAGIRIEFATDGVIVIVFCSRLLSFANAVEVNKNLITDTQTTIQIIFFFVLIILSLLKRFDKKQTCSKS